MVDNSLRGRLGSGQPVRNAWLTVGDCGLAETVAASPGVDAVTIDLQHSEIAESSVAGLIRAIELGGSAPMARLAGPDSGGIGRLLDLGCAGLIMPTVSSPEAASAFVSATRYPPAGERSHGPIRERSAKIGPPVLWAMIESEPGLELVEEIAAIEGIDGLFVGPGDLGISLGIGGGQNRSEPEFLAALEKVKISADTAGLWTGIHSTSAEYSKQMFASGFNLVTVWVDAVAIANSLLELGGLDA